MYVMHSSSPDPDLFAREEWEVEADHKIRSEFLLKSSELLDINEELLIAYTDQGHHFCKNRQELDTFIRAAKQRIAKRAHILDRWEPWEIPTGGSIRQVHSLLMGRAKTKEEKDLVSRYSRGT